MKIGEVSFAAEQTWTRRIHDASQRLSGFQSQFASHTKRLFNKSQSQPEKSLDWQQQLIDLEDISPSKARCDHLDKCTISFEQVHISTYVLPSTPVFCYTKTRKAFYGDGAGRGQQTVHAYNMVWEIGRLRRKGGHKNLLCAINNRIAWPANRDFFQTRTIL